jgi:hypothetical protein
MRAKTALAHIKDMDLKCSESTFEKVIYKFRQHHLPGAKKPKLNKGCQSMRRWLADYLLSINLHSICFIDKANIRSEYRKEHVWHNPKEYHHPNVKQPTTKQAYQKAEFISAIKWGEPPSPHHVFKPETLTEKKEADNLIKKMQ